MDLSTIPEEGSEKGEGNDRPLKCFLKEPCRSVDQKRRFKELMNIKPVGEQGIDALFTEIERITEWYIKADGKGEAMNNK